MFFEIFLLWKYDFLLWEYGSLALKISFFTLKSHACESKDLDFGHKYEVGEKSMWKKFAREISKTSSRMKDSLILYIKLSILNVQNQGIFHSRTRLRYLARNFFFTPQKWVNQICYLDLLLARLDVSSLNKGRILLMPFLKGLLAVTAKH